MTAVFYTVFAVGLYFIIGYSEISIPIRRFLYGVSTIKVECPKCRAYTFSLGILDESDPKLELHCAHCRKPISIDFRRTDSNPTFEIRFISRWLVNMLECAGCLGFWTGMVSGFILEPSMFQIQFPIWRLLWMPVLGIFTAGSNLILARLIGMVGSPHPLKVEIEQRLPVSILATVKNTSEKEGE